MSYSDTFKENHICGLRLCSGLFACKRVSTVEENNISYQNDAVFQWRIQGWAETAGGPPYWRRKKIEKEKRGRKEEKKKGGKEKIKKREEKRKEKRERVQKRGKKKKRLAGEKERQPNGTKN